jgi:hypothetical protein
MLGKSLSHKNVSTDAFFKVYGICGSGPTARYASFLQS